MTASTLQPVLADEARDWLAAAPWPDMTPDEALQLSDGDASAAICGRFPGGLAAFADARPSRAA